MRKSYLPMGWILVLSVMVGALTGVTSQAQVIARATRGGRVEPLRVETWPAWLSLAWERISLPQSGEVEQASEIRGRIVEELMKAGHSDQAFAVAGLMQGFGRYQTFARLAQRLTGTLRETAEAEAQRGFQFLSARNQERLVADLMAITVPKGQRRLDVMLERCLDQEDRIVALGRAASAAANSGQVAIFQACVAELTKDVGGLNALEKRHTVKALLAAAEGLQNADLRSHGEWLELCGQATEILEQCALNSADLHALNARICFEGEHEEKGREALERAHLQLKQLGAGTSERMHAMIAMTEAVRASKGSRLPENWCALALYAAESGADDWRWDLLVKAGTITRLVEGGEAAVKIWRRAMESAESNPNEMVGMACAALIAMEAHDAGLTADETLVTQLKLAGSEGMKKEGTSER